MATPEQVAAAHYAEQRSLVERMVELIRQLGRDLRWDEVRAWFAGPAAVLAEALASAQLQAAQQGSAYVAAAALAGGVTPRLAGEVDVEPLVGVASDGRPLESLLAFPIVRGRELVESGLPEADVTPRVMASLVMIGRTQVADAGRVASSIAIVGDSALYGYARVVQLPACARCVVLAGRIYTWSDGFARHPACDCVHLPMGSKDDLEAVADQHHERIVGNMSDAELRRTFGRAGARAIADGADAGQVVKARQGMYTTADGRKATWAGTTRRGLAGKRLGAKRGQRAKTARLMPEEIYAEAGDDREKAQRLLHRYGYLV